MEVILFVLISIIKSCMNFKCINELFIKHNSILWKISKNSSWVAWKGALNLSKNVGDFKLLHLPRRHAHPWRRRESDDDRNVCLHCSARSPSRTSSRKGSVASTSTHDYWQAGVFRQVRRERKRSSGFFWFFGRFEHDEQLVELFFWRTHSGRKRRAHRRRRS